MKSNRKMKNNKGFTLIELLVVVAIISLLSSIGLIAFQDARQKSRDAKRLSDMTQMANALEIYFAYNKGYPSDTTEMRTAGVIMTLPTAPQPPDGDCVSAIDTYGNSVFGYNYYPSGTSFMLNGKQLYPGYYLSFCLGHKTGDFPQGLHNVTPTGIK